MPKAPKSVIAVRGQIERRPDPEVRYRIDSSHPKQRYRLRNTRAVKPGTVIISPDGWQHPTASHTAEEGSSRNSTTEYGIFADSQTRPRRKEGSAEPRTAIEGDHGRVEINHPCRPSCRTQAVIGETSR